MLQVQLILNKVTKSGVRKALRQISTELDQLFGDTLSRIRRQPTELQEIALSTLMWLSCARRPLSISELQHAITTRSDEHQIDPDEDCPPLEIIIESCFGLVTVGHDEPSVRLCHFSLQEYLESQRETLFPQAQITITRACLTYLLYEIPEAAPIERDTKAVSPRVDVELQHLPFLRYAAEYWGCHAKAAVLDAIKDVALSFAKDLHKTIRAARILALSSTNPRRNFASAFMHPGDRGTRSEETIGRHARNFTCGLHFAARFDLSELLRYLLEQGLDVNSMDVFDNANTALHIAASRGHLGSVNALLDHNANLNLYNADHDTPLFLAACGEHYEVAKAMIQRNASINMQCSYSWTALHKVVDLGQLEFVRLLLSYGASIRMTTSRGLYPLHRACGRGHCEIIELLLRRGAPIDATTADGWTALHGAARSGQVEVVQILLEHNSDPNCRTVEGRTPLHHACHGGHVEVVQLLLNHGANLLAEDGFGQLPIHRAAKGDHPKVLELLLNLDLSQISKNDHSGEPPLRVTESEGSFQAGDFLRHVMRSRLGLIEKTKADLEIAIEEGDAELVKTLISHGADVNIRGDRGETALQQALRNDKDEIASTLLQAGADVETKGTKKWRALHVAARRGNSRAVRLCLEYLPDINAVTSLYRTALHLACCSRNVETVRLLIESGCDLEAMDEHRLKPIHIAASHGHEGAVRVLLEKGASLNVGVSGAGSVQGCAARGCHYALVEFLREMTGLFFGSRFYLPAVKLAVADCGVQSGPPHIRGKAEMSH